MKILDFLPIFADIITNKIKHSFKRILMQIDYEYEL